MTQAKWIWYPGDYELYHNQLVHNRREEYDWFIPAMWHVVRPESACRFTKKITLAAETSAQIYAKGRGYISIDGKKCSAVNKAVQLPAGTFILTVDVSCPEAFPAVFIDTPGVETDETWVVHFDGAGRKYAAWDPAFTRAEDDPAVFPFSYKELIPVSCEPVSEGTLYDFGRESFGPVHIQRTKQMGDIHIYYGESREEALDTEYTLVRQHISSGDGTIDCPARAFRYIYLKAGHGTPALSAEEEYLPIEDIGSFRTDDEKLLPIWDICTRAFHLNSREFYFDGIKRDRWVWSGDAYQSYKIGRYLFRDREITKRTIRALLGKPPYFQHINTINDYSMYLIIAVKEYYEASGDRDFVISIKDELYALYDFIVSRLDEETGYMVEREGDWIFIDWADMDKNGPVCAEQILLYQVYKAMEVITEITKDAQEDFGDLILHSYASSVKAPAPVKAVPQDASERAEKLKQRILRDFWCEEKHAFIDTYASGRNNVTRHANIFAIMFDIVDGEKKKQIAEEVLLKDEVPQITTPYFKLYELMALGETGYISAVQEYIDSYWGGMVENGATSAWEEYDPQRKGTEHYEMYGDRYGCSLCHAWGSGPIYLLERYCAGVYGTSVGEKTFDVRPDPGRYASFHAVVPIGEGQAEVSYADGRITVKTTVPGGTLYWKEQTVSLKPEREYTL